MWYVRDIEVKNIDDDASKEILIGASFLNNPLLIVFDVDSQTIQDTFSYRKEEQLLKILNLEMSIMIIS